jgi:hypothetical protein
MPDIWVGREEHYDYTIDEQKPDCPEFYTVVHVSDEWLERYKRILSDYMDMQDHLKSIADGRV